MKTTFFAIRNVFTCLLVSLIVQHETIQAQTASVLVQPSPGVSNYNESGSVIQTEAKPQFPGGEAALVNFIQANIHYPDQALGQAMGGKVVVHFSIDEHGKVSDASIVGNKSGYGFDEEALRVINDIPTRMLKNINGQNAKTYWTLPIVFKL